MSYWLFKSEPSEYGIEDLQQEPNQTTRWDGIRNFQARNFIRDQIQLGDEVLIYHSQTQKVGIVGQARVVSTPYSDPSQFDENSLYFDAKSRKDAPKWFAVDIQFQAQFKSPLLLKDIKRIPALADMTLLKQGRLSIHPITELEWQTIMSLTMV